MLSGELVTRSLELHRQDTSLTAPRAGRLIQLHVLIPKTAFLRWLESQGYDITNERSRRTAWVRDGGWHLKCCINLTTGTEDFWLVSFNGKGGELISDKSQRDYCSAYRYLHANGFTHPQLEGMERGELYQKYNAAQVENNAQRPESKPRTRSTGTGSTRPHIDTTDYTKQGEGEGCFNKPMRGTNAQRKFADSVWDSCQQKCVVSGVTFFHATDAAHITPHSEGGRMQVFNGITLDAGIHRVFDAGHMAINPETMTAHFSATAQESGYAHLEGRKIETVYQLNADALMKRWDKFCGTHGEPDCQNRRVSYQEFREGVLLNFQVRCAISGSTKDVDAAHIVPCGEAGGNETSNGLALCNYIHHAFDKFILSIDPATRLIVVAPDHRHILNIHGHALREPVNEPINPAALAKHYAQFLELNKHKGIDD